MIEIDRIFEDGNVFVTVDSMISYCIQFDKEEIELFSENEIKDACERYLMDQGLYTKPSMELCEICDKPAKWIYIEPISNKEIFICDDCREILQND